MAKLGSELKEINFQLVQTIADQQMTEDRLHLQLARLKLMYDFVSALNAAHTVNDIYQIALNVICAALQTDRAAVMIVDSQQSLRYQESINISEDYKHSTEDFFDALTSTLKLKSGAFPDCAILPSDIVLQNICKVENISAWAVFPLEYERRHVGNIFAYFDAPRQFTEEEVQLTQTIVTYIAIALTRKQVETKLQSSLAEKEVLLREVHHRVKNNLGMVDSLLSMQARYVNDAEALRLLSDSQRRIHAMSLIHEQLYQSQDVGKVNFCEYLQRLVGNLYNSTSFNNNQIELKLEITPSLSTSLLDIDNAISIGLVVNELLTNAFKHAFPDQNGGLIEVILYESLDDHTLHLIIRDNGVGIPKTVDLNSSVSLGLRLVNILTQQLRAHLDLSCSLGTSFHFTFHPNL